MAASLPRPGRLPSALVLAGLLALAVWGFLRMSRAPVGAPSSIRAITATEVPADRPLLLAWEGAGPPYRVELRGASGREIWTSPPIPAPLVRVPAEVQRSLALDASYVWSVEGVDGRNQAVRSPDFVLRLLAPGAERRSRGDGHAPAAGPDLEPA